MAIFDDNGNQYNIDPKTGEKIIVSPESFFYEVDGIKFVMYDKKSGELALNIKDNELEKLLNNIGKIPPEGININLGLPPFNEPQYFEGIKKIVKLQQDKEN